MAFNDKLLAKNTSVAPADFSAQIDRKPLPLYLKATKGAAASVYRTPYALKMGGTANLAGRIYLRAEDANGKLVTGSYGYVDVSGTSLLATEDDGAVTVGIIDYSDASKVVGLTGLAVKVVMDTDALGNKYFGLQITGAAEADLLMYAELRTTEIRPKATPFRGI